MTIPTIGDGSPSPYTAAADIDAANRRGVPSASRSSGFRGFAARRPIAALLIMAFSIAYPVMIIVALVVHGVIPGRALLDRLPIPPDEVAGLMLTVLALLPSAIYVTWAADGREGVRNLLRRVTRWRFGLGWWLFILTAMPLLTVVVGLLLGDSFVRVNPVQFLLDQVWLLLINLLLVNLWEETAWAGVVQTRLERRHNVFVAALITAVPFGFVHLPLAFLTEVTIASVAISLAVYIGLGVFLSAAGRPDHARRSGQRVALRAGAQRLQPDQQRQRHRRNLARRQRLQTGHLDRHTASDGGRSPLAAPQARRVLPSPDGGPLGTSGESWLVASSGPRCSQRGPGAQRGRAPRPPHPPYLSRHFDRGEQAHAGQDPF